MGVRQLVWAGAALDPSGYGHVTRNYLRNLADLPEWSIKLRQSYFWRGEMPDLTLDMPMIKRLHANDFNLEEPYIFLQHLTPENYIMGMGKCHCHIGMTTFETEGIPRHWQLQMRSQDEIFTFSQFNKQMFQEAGIKRPITIIPHGVDVASYHPMVTPMPCVQDYRKDRPDLFVFGAVFDWTERKNPRMLLEAYFTAFKDTDPVLLVLKTFQQYPPDPQCRDIKKAIDSIRKKLGIVKGPAIAIISDIFSEQDLPHFYAALDAYVLPSRGEGFGLTYAEAMSTGLPTVAMGWSGHLDFMNDSNSYLLKDIKVSEITAMEAGPQAHYAGLKWANGKPEELSGVMRQIFNSPTEARAIGQKARSDMIANWTWQHASMVLRQELERIGDTT